MRAEADALMAFWCAAGPDREFGGFHGKLDRQGRPEDPTHKGLIQQSRHLWTLAMWAERRKAPSLVTALAHSQFEFLQRFLLDPHDGEFYFLTSREGDVLDRKKQLYAEAFVIYALAQYALSFSVGTAAEAALRCFRSIDQRAHDDDFGGYDQTGDPGFLVAGAQKGTNTHIHLLEAFTTLLRATGDRLVEQRLGELASVVSDSIVQPSGYAHQAFLRDWTPFGPPRVSYGHDLETAWLVEDALLALDQCGATHRDALRIRGRLLHLARSAADAGFDEQLGGIFEEGPAQSAAHRAQPGRSPFPAADRREKVWWVQAEALAGLWYLHASTSSPRALIQLERTLGWIEEHQRDAEYPGWYWGLDGPGRVASRGTHKGELWKTGYHDVRALTYTADWIASALDRRQA